MKYVMVYWSRFGHNKKIVEKLSKKLKEKGAETKIFKTDETDPKKIPEADTYIFSASAEAFRVQKNMRKFMKNLEGTGGKKYGIINTHALKRKNWLKGMDKILSKKNMKKVAEMDFHIGKEGQEQGEGFTENWEEKIDEFSKKL
jgi:menaquinone-dependent protoporphyrinogen IX oxidase